MLKLVSGNDPDYVKLMKKCIHKPDNVEDSLYKIDTEGFLLFKIWIYVPNQSNIKHIIFRELHDNPYAGHPGYHKFIIALKKDFIGQIWRKKLQNM